MPASVSAFLRFGEPRAVFGLEVPVHVPEVPDQILDPRSTWKDPMDYDTHAARLAALFHRNFEQFAARVPPAVREAGPAKG